MCLTSPELWPAQAKQWFQLHDRFFWQERAWAAGFREFPTNSPRSDWTMDVDAGPVVAGYGVSACAFGVGAARKNGRFDRAGPLSAEMLATVGELPNGVLIVPRLLSNFSEAPLLGEAGILWQLSIQPEKQFPIKTGGGVPTYVYVVLIGVFVFGCWRILEAIWAIKEVRRPDEPKVWVPGVQVVVWIGLLAAALGATVLGRGLPGFVALIVALALPIRKKVKPPKGAEDWPEPEAPKAQSAAQ
jgi:hypothetical protein